MSIRTRNLPIMTLLAVAASLSCSEKNDPGVPIVPPHTAAPSPGISQSLTRNDKPPLYHFDRFGPVKDPTLQKSFEIPGDVPQHLEGWAVDPTTNALSGGVDIVIDSTTFTAAIGLNRADVAVHFKRPDYAGAGFELTLPVGRLTKGAHAISIRVIASDRKSYYQGEAVPFTVN